MKKYLTMVVKCGIILGVNREIGPGSEAPWYNSKLLPVFLRSCRAFCAATLHPQGDGFSFGSEAPHEEQRRRRVHHRGHERVHRPDYWTRIPQPQETDQGTEPTGKGDIHSFRGLGDLAGTSHRIARGNGLGRNHSRNPMRRQRGRVLANTRLRSLRGIAQTNNPAHGRGVIHARGLGEVL